MPKSPILGKITFSSLSLPEQIQMSNLQDAVNILGGHSGEVELSNHLNLSGNKITNVGTAESANDVLTSGVAETKYSAHALRPKLESAGEAPLRTFLTSLKGDVTASGPGSANSKVQSISGVTLDRINGNLKLSQLPTSGLSATITTAKLTSGGTEGSMTFTNGLLTSSTPAT